MERAETRGPRAFGPRHHHPVVLFLQGRCESRNVQAPHLLGPSVESELCERYPQLGRPSLAVDGRSRLPHGIEARVGAFLVVAGVIPVETNARCTDAE